MRISAPVISMMDLQRNINRISTIFSILAMLQIINNAERTLESLILAYSVDSCYGKGPVLLIVGI